MQRLDGEVADLLVIGGGSWGAALHMRARGSGLKVALIDQGDFGGATSAASSKLIHGGLRYLATGDMRLVRELQRERAVLRSQVAPHLVQPLNFVLAVERSHVRGAAKLVAALALYSAASGFRRPRPRLLLRKEAMEFVPFDPAAILRAGSSRRLRPTMPGWHSSQLARLTASVRDTELRRRCGDRALAPHDLRRGIDRITGEHLTTRLAPS